MRILVAFTTAASAPVKDVVDSLPGWHGPLLSKTYAGYISAGSDGDVKMFEHYLFFESEGDPAKDPVMMWTNGGPGAPSFFGSFTELGPYYVSDASLATKEYNETGVPTLFQNVHSWTKQSNLLIRNLPPPVGYSYCEPAGPSGDGYSCGDWDDARTAKHSYEFLNNWFDAFPEYASSDLYLSGESYAGVYVPTLAREILNHADSTPARQLKGFAVGDGVTGHGDCSWGPKWHVEFFHGHGQFSTKTYNEIQQACSEEELSCGATSSACKAALDKMDEEKGYSFGYGLYDECYDFDLSATRWDAPRPHGKTPRSSGYERHSMDGSPCGGSGSLSAWAKHAAVKEALHVAKDANYFSGDNGVGFNYKSTEPDLTAFYKHVATETKLRVLIYNGDADPGLNSFRGENFTRGIGLKETEAWRPWTIDGRMRMGGFVTRYEGDFDYLTIRGAGHMVPQYKPEAASAFLDAWLRNVEYPRLQKPTDWKSIV
jgi:carboxypeptidase C (cathepsin A)